MQWTHLWQRQQEYRAKADAAGEMDLWTHSDRGSMHRLQPEGVPALRWGHGLPTLIRKLSSRDNCLQGKISFSNGVSLDILATLEGRHRDQLQNSTKWAQWCSHRLIILLVFCSYSIVFDFVILWVLLLYVCFLCVCVCFKSGLLFVTCLFAF